MPRQSRHHPIRSSAGGGYSDTPESDENFLHPRCNRQAFRSERLLQRIANSDVELQLHDLFVRGQAGDAAAYAVFLRHLTKHLRAYLARRLFGWPDDVEDLVQECLLAMHNQRHTYEPDQPLTAWVHAIARYKLIDLLRTKGTREALHDPLDDDMPLFADSLEDAGNARRDLAGLLQTLPDRHRLPIVHVKLEGRSVSEMALLTGMSKSGVKVGIHRGLKTLAAKLGQNITKPMAP